MKDGFNAAIFSVAALMLSKAVLVFGGNTSKEMVYLSSFSKLEIFMGISPNYRPKEAFFTSSSKSRTVTPAEAALKFKMTR